MRGRKLMKKVYLDESGNTGGIAEKNGKFNIGQQDYFVYGGVITDESEEPLLLSQYSQFKLEHESLQDEKNEIKGNDLFKNEEMNNRALEDFISNYLDSRHFYVNIYDKYFYIATELVISILGFEFRDKNLAYFYEMVNSLLKYDGFLQIENLFLKATNIDKSDLKERERALRTTLRQFRKLIRQDSQFKFLDSRIKKLIKDNQSISQISNSILYKGAYTQDRKISNLINLTALGELLVQLIKQGRIDENSSIILDPICSIDQVILSELEPSSLDIRISEGSHIDELIQYADNVVSVIYKSFSNVIKDFKNKGFSWTINTNNIWNLLVFSFVLSQIDCKNIKFTLPIDDWAFCLAIDKLKFGVTALEQNSDITQLVTVITESLNSNLSEANEKFWTYYEESRNEIIGNYNSMSYNFLEDLNHLLN